VSRLEQFIVVVLCVLPLCCGCGRGGRPEIAPVSGQVLVDGQPLANGRIEFIPERSRSSYGNLDAEGRFELTCRDPGDGAVLGTHHIAVDGSEVLSTTNTVTKLKWHAPKKYASAATSGLTETISEPRKDLMINLSWDGGKPFVETIEENPEPVIHGRHHK